MLDPEELERRLLEEGPEHWLHRFEVIKGSGVFTPGHNAVGDFGARLRRFDVDAESLQGKRCLDVGTWSGGNAFAMEDLGADVVAVDIQNPHNTGFSLVHELRESSVDYVQCSVYDLTPEEFGHFDVIWCSGVLYHLKHPILALERLNSVCRKGSLLLVQGRGCDFWFFDDDPRRGACFEKLERGEATPENVMSVDSINDLPVAGFVREKYVTDDSVWFLPNLKCLEAWLKRTGFQVLKSFTVAAPMASWAWTFDDGVSNSRVPEGVTGSSGFAKAIWVGPPEPEYADTRFRSRVGRRPREPLLHHYRVGVTYDMTSNVVIKGHRKAGSRLFRQTSPSRAPKD